MAARPVEIANKTTKALLDTVVEVGPTTAGALFDRIGAAPSPTRVAELANIAPVFCTSVKNVRSAALSAVFVGRPGDAEAALEDDGLVLALLRLPVLNSTPKKPTKARAYTLAGLQKKVPAPYREAFARVLKRRLEDNAWPVGVGTIRAERAELVFLLEDVKTSGSLPVSVGQASVGQASVGQATAANPRQEPGWSTNGEGHGEPAAAAQKPFAPSFEHAFQELVSRGRSRLVRLADLRAALPSFTREDFDGGLRQLREQGDDYVLQSFDGRHGEVSQEVLEGAIREGGRTYVFVTRRDL